MGLQDKIKDKMEDMGDKIEEKKQDAQERIESMKQSDPKDKSSDAE